MQLNSSRLTRRVLLLASVSGLLALTLTAAGLPSSGGATDSASGSGFAGMRLRNVAKQAGLDFRQGAFRFGVSRDPTAMTGGGLCALDYNGDGWVDLFVVNSYAEADYARWQARGGLPRSALFENRGGHFTNVTRRAHAGLAVRGEGCVAADFNGDGRTDLFVTTADGNDKLLWNNGDGTFSEGARAAGIRTYGWHTGAAVADVNGDGRPDLFVAGYADPNLPVENSAAGFPNNVHGVRDLLYLNLGRDQDGHSRFREVGIDAGLEAARFDHSLGAVFSDFDGDGRPDIYVANDGDPNRLYENVRWPGGKKADPAGLGFRFEERAAIAGVADPNAGMGVSAADFTGDGKTDLFVSNSRGQGHAVYAGQAPLASGSSFTDVRTSFATAFGRRFTGWGASWVDLDNNGSLDLVLTNGGIPVTNLVRNAQPIQVLENLGAPAGSPPKFADGTALLGGLALPRVVGRGLVTADFSNDGRMDIAINTIGGKVQLLRPTGGTLGHWLEVRLAGFSPGAQVTAVLPDGRKLVRDVQAGSSYLSSQDPRLQFGLGTTTRVSRLVVRYPNPRRVVVRTNVHADRIVTMAAPSAAKRFVAAPHSASSYTIAGCTRADLHGHSVARVWDEAMLDAIRRDIPAPTTHARNLFHVSAAMWDAWAAYDPKAEGYFVREKHRAADIEAAREAAISYAAYRVLLWRYAYGANMRVTFNELTNTLRSLCYRADYTRTEGSSPAAFGNRIAAAVIAYGRRDGALERLHFADESYVPVNTPLVVAQPGTAMHDATFWQPLALDQTVAQNGLAVPGKVQTFIGAQWGHVRGFALPPSKKGAPIDPGPPPIGTPEDAAYKQAAVDVIRASSELDPSDGTTIDIGLDARGDNPLGTNDGHGYAVNPVTGQPYAPERVPRADFERVLAEFWADGPNSETPPGHWNVIANTVSDSPLMAAKIGPNAADRLKWDVKLYFALNGAVHDAAIAAWGLKREYQSVRPISMIRYLAGQGQSSDPKLPSYSAEGLPLIPGLIELVSKANSAPGQPMASLADHVGEVAIRAWRGNPKDPTKTSGVGWILGERWVPYQKPTFVTPAFPGFVSGHSTFSRAAAEVLAAYTGSAYFPGGLFERTFAPGYLKFEGGPSKPITLEWATYYDAADQAGISRIYGGIHIPADDFAGRRIGSKVGKAAWALAQRYFAGTAPKR